ncbi:hypothetical protein C8R47DRAFT_1073622 [Mycena vitilis]|nr:hypothetical protein C8R47DRAFT_1073622 [Mycena vitilis]
MTVVRIAPRWVAYGREEYADRRTVSDRFCIAGSRKTRTRIRSCPETIIAISTAAGLLDTCADPEDKVIRGRGRKSWRKTCWHVDDLSRAAASCAGNAPMNLGFTKRLSGHEPGYAFAWLLRGYASPRTSRRPNKPRPLLLALFASTLDWAFNGSYQMARTSRRCVSIHLSCLAATAPAPATSSYTTQLHPSSMGCRGFMPVAYWCTPLQAGRSAAPRAAYGRPLGESQTSEDYRITLVCRNADISGSMRFEFLVLTTTNKSSNKAWMKGMMIISEVTFLPAYTRAQIITVSAFEMLTEGMIASPGLAVAVKKIMSVVSDETIAALDAHSAEIASLRDDLDTLDSTQRQNSQKKSLITPRDVNEAPSRHSGRSDLCRGRKTGSTRPTLACQFVTAKRTLMAKIHQTSHRRTDRVWASEARVALEGLYEDMDGDRRPDSVRDGDEEDGSVESKPPMPDVAHILSAVTVTGQENPYDGPHFDSAPDGGEEDGSIESKGPMPEVSQSPGLCVSSADDSSQENEVNDLHPDSARDGDEEAGCMKYEVPVPEVSQSPGLCVSSADDHPDSARDGDEEEGSVGSEPPMPDVALSKQILSAVTVTGQENPYDDPHFDSAPDGGEEDGSIESKGPMPEVSQSPGLCVSSADDSSQENEVNDLHPDSARDGDEEAGCMKYEVPVPEVSQSPGLCVSSADNLSQENEVNDLHPDSVHEGDEEGDSCVSMTQGDTAGANANPSGLSKFQSLTCVTQHQLRRYTFILAIVATRCGSYVPPTPSIIWKPQFGDSVTSLGIRERLQHVQNTVIFQKLRLKDWHTGEGNSRTTQRLGILALCVLLSVLPFVLGLAFPKLTSPLLVHVFARDNQRLSVVRAIRQSRRPPSTLDAGTQA